MKKLNIVYVHRLPRHPEDLPHDTVEVYIGISRRGVEMDIVRNGFLAADHVQHAIESHIRELDTASVRTDQPLAVRVGLFPSVRPEWRIFLDNLLQQDDSWAFIVPAKMACAAS